MVYSTFKRALGAAGVVCFFATPAFAIDLGENAEYGKILGDFR